MIMFILVIMLVIISVVMFMLVIRFVKVIILVNLLNVDDHNDHGVYGHIFISMAGSAATFYSVSFSKPNPVWFGKVKPQKCIRFSKPI